MTTTRRTIMQTGLAAAGAASAPGILSAQTRPPAARTIRVALAGDLATYDPIWTTANITAYHGAMVYDTLFGIDDKLQPQPQMVQKYTTSEDQLTWTFLDMKNDGGRMAMMWGNTLASTPFKAIAAK